MKNLILSILLLPTFILSDYLQDGLYPECSYVIVDQDGWKIHKNQDGKIISMTPKSKHNDKMGKYSFDKFGNLVPFRECTKNNIINSKNSDKNDVEIEIELEMNLFNLLQDFKVYGGLSMPFGTSADLYESGMNFGSTITLYKKIGGELNITNFSGKDSNEDISAMSAIGTLNHRFSNKFLITVGGGLSKIDNGTGISAITNFALSYDLPLNLGLNAKYSKYIGASKDDGSIEFDYELLDSFNLNLYYSF